MSTFVEKRKQFMDVLRGVNAREAAKAMNGLTPSVNWTGTSKGHMADEWAKAQSQADHAHTRQLKTVTIAAFREAVQQHKEKARG